MQSTEGFVVSVSNPMSAQSSGHEPGSFTSSLSSSSISAGAGPSSNGSSRPSYRQPSNIDSTQSSHAGSQNQIHDEEGGGEQHDQYRVRRHRPRGSGGFLLQNIKPSHTSILDKRRSTRSDEATKGKRKAENGDLKLPKRGGVPPWSTSSLRASPLSTEVISSQDGVEDSERGQRTAPAPPPSHRYTSPSYSRDRLAAGAHTSEAVGRDHDRDYNASSIGQYIDPAQIVNLALNLSESRRRNVSASTLLGPSQLDDRVRMSSMERRSPGGPYKISGGSLQQALKDQRRMSRNVSTRSGRSSENGQVGRPTSYTESRSQCLNSSMQSYQPMLKEGEISNVTDATLARAEKARTFLELGYEYRRLLEYLPAIPRVSQKVSAVENGVDKPWPTSSSNYGRAYNPLQYVRNRKLRYRNKKPLNPEMDGWNDLDGVRAWVSSVQRQRDSGLTDGDHNFSLPAFDASKSRQTQIDDLGSPIATRSRDLPTSRLMRPSRDWTFAPWDLFADAYWVYQDSNIQKLEDATGRKIFTPSKPLSEPSEKASNEITRGMLPRSSVSLTRNGGSPSRCESKTSERYQEFHRRGRYRNSDHEPQSSVEESRYRTRKSQWSKKLLRSRSSSSGSDSDWSKHSGPRRALKGREDFDNAALERHMMDMLAQENEDEHSIVDSKPNNSKLAVRRNDELYSDLNNEMDHQKSHPVQRSTADLQASKMNVPTADQRLDDKAANNHETSSDGLTTAPNSPPTADTQPKTSLHHAQTLNAQQPLLSPVRDPILARLGSSRHHRSRSTDKRHSDDIYTKKAGPRNPWSSPPLSRQATNDHSYQDRFEKGRTSDQANMTLSPTNSEMSNSTSYQREFKSDKSFREMNSSDSRLRGFFRGGRLAGLVGNEVSRMSDILWRKDNSKLPSQIASPSSSLNSLESDVENGNAFGVENSPYDSISRVTTNTDQGPKISQKSNTDRSKLHMNNFPTFRSPFARLDQSSTLAENLPSEDYVIRQQRAMKDQKRVNKFDRLVPPRIDIRGVSISPSPGHSRSRGLEAATRDSSRDRSSRGVRQADKRLNAVLGTPGTVGTGLMAPTGLATLSSKTDRHRNRPQLEGNRQWSISDRGVSAVRGTISKRDIARVRALLLSSGVKANEIARRAEEAPDTISPLIAEVQDVIKDHIPPLPPSKEFVFIARALIANIEDTNSKLRSAAEAFSRQEVEKLHNQVKAIDERVTFDLTPMVRAAADDADGFSTELTTTRMLAVRRLNDSVDAILRRRRRRMRWIRRGVWALVEWTLLGLMWMVWFIVVIVRLVRGTIGTFVRAIRWLFWL